MSPDVWAWPAVKSGCLQPGHPLGHSRTSGVFHLHLRSRSWLKGIATHALRNQGKKSDEDGMYVPGREFRKRENMWVDTCPGK